jgi:hypothetical protein
MAERDTTTNQDKETQVKIEAYAAIQRAKEILSGLAAVALLRIQAAEGADFSASFWRDFYKGAPWGPNPGEPAGILPAGLEETLNQVIFQQLGQAWHELNEKAELVFGPDFVKEVWIKRHQGEGQEEVA